MWTREKVAEIFFRCLGEEGARKLVETTCTTLRLGLSFSKDEAMKVLESLSQKKDIVGITAGLAKARMHLSRVHDALDKK